MLIIAMTTLVLCIVGLTMNMEATNKNGGRMPVLWDAHYESDRHFTYQNISEVKAWIFTDIITIGENILSVGDLFIYFGMLSYIFFVIVFIKNKLVTKKRRKKR
jgi:hypothetical protein